MMLRTVPDLDGQGFIWVSYLKVMLYMLTLLPSFPLLFCLYFSEIQISSCLLNIKQEQDNISLQRHLGEQALLLWVILSIEYSHQKAAHVGVQRVTAQWGLLSSNTDFYHFPKVLLKEDLEIIALYPLAVTLVPFPPPPLSWAVHHCKRQLQVPELYKSGWKLKTSLLSSL